MQAFSENRRYLALWLPLLSSDRIYRLRRQLGGTRDERPLVIVGHVKGSLCIRHSDQKARKLGLHPELTLAAARARTPDLLVADEDVEADKNALGHVADWCERYSPLVAIHGSQGITLDITGVTHLFKGESALRTEIISRLNTTGFNTRSAIAGSPEAAHALACFTKGIIAPPGSEALLVGPLPVSALGLDAAQAMALRRAGLKTIADLRDKPRPPLAARFGAELLARLACVLAETSRPISPRRLAPEKVCERHFAEPIARAEDLLGATEALARELAPLLESQGEGGRVFEASFFRADGVVRRITLSTGQAVREPKVLGRLFAQKIGALADPIDPGFGFDFIRLAALATEARPSAQASFDRDEENREEVLEMVDRLGAQFEPRKITRFVGSNSHIPEQEKQIAALSQRTSDTGGWKQLERGEPPARPLNLFDPPEPIETLAAVPDGPPRYFRWRRVLHNVAYSEGPERIAPEWWKPDPAPFTRDYFRVEDLEGRRFWVYREGLHEKETPTPRWYIHGLFA